MVSVQNIKELSRLELSSASFIELERDIVCVYYKASNDELGLKTAEAHTGALYDLRGGKACHLILVFRDKLVAFSNEARDHFAKNTQHSAIRLSQALVLEGLANMIVANFYIKFNRPNCPVKVFSKIEPALAWSLSL